MTDTTNPSDEFDGDPSSGQFDPAIAALPPKRVATVQRAMKAWANSLIDLSRRNNLLYYRTLNLGSVELEDVDQNVLMSLLAGESARLTNLLPNRDIAEEQKSDEKLVELFPDETSVEQTGIFRRLTEIQKKAIENFEEKGLETMFLAVGLATWNADDGGRDPAAPILLCPVNLEGKGLRLGLARRGDLEINLTLTHILETQFGCAGLADELRELVADDDEVGGGDAVERLVKMLEARASHMPGFRILNKLAISNFSFQKLAMVKDLQRWGMKAALNDLIAGIAGDMDVRAELRERSIPLDPRELDRRPAAAEFLVRDADSSQQAVIASVVAGQSGVISGPPGTGKSQTITNLIAEVVANGKSVLFVAEKRAALDVVKRRLEEVGLGHLVLDLHGHVTKREVMAQFKASLDRIENSVPVDATQLHREFESRRRQLNNHIEALHHRRDPFELSVYQLQGRLLRLPDGSANDVRWRGAELKKLSADVMTKVAEVLLEARSVETLFLGSEDSPWSGAKLPTADSVQKALDLVIRWTVPRFRRSNELQAQLSTQLALG